MPKRPVRKKSKTNWKIARFDNKLHKKNKLAFGVLGLLIFILLIGQTVNAVYKLFSPINNERESKRPYSISKDFNINLVFKSNPFSLVNFNAEEKTVTLINIPDDIYIDVPGGFGIWQVRAIHNLGDTNKIFGGWSLLKRSFSNLFGLPIDGYVDLKSQNTKTGTEIIDSLRQNPLNVWSILSNVEADLTPWELINLKLIFSGVRFDKVQTIDLKKFKLLEESKLGDSTPILVADPFKLDSADIDFVDRKIRKEQLGIAIFNATDHPGLAQKAARIVKNIGGNVIVTGNTIKKVKDTQVLTQDDEESETKKRLMQIFTRKCFKDEGCDRITDDPEVNSSRAKINIILGEDFYSF
ncbi:LCP family protein [Candidatus Daviesbacteria bacterium]|nr:LCP family protein [Candidatus Daviesbacteria bacterium]